MTNAKLIWTSNTGASTKTYLIEGLLLLGRKKTQSSIDLPFPLIADNGTIINSIFGQKRVFNGNFLIMDRTDDYTDGTGTPVNYSAREQEDYLMDTIFAPTGYHSLVFVDGTTYTGRIEDVSIEESGDDPIKFNASFVFKRGLVPLAGQFTPF